MNNKATEHQMPPVALLRICRCNALVVGTNACPQATGADQVLALPEWSDCESAVDEKMATPLQEFIYEYEPGNNDKEWRARLTAALAQARKEGAQGAWGEAVKALCIDCAEGDTPTLDTQARWYYHSEGQQQVGCSASKLRLAVAQQTIGTPELLSDSDYTLVADAINVARQVQEFIWEGCYPALRPYDSEGWRRLFQKRVDCIAEVDLTRHGGLAALRKRLLQQAALSIKALALLNRWVKAHPITLSDGSDGSDLEPASKQER